MIPRHFTNDPAIILSTLIFHDFHHFEKVVRSARGSRGRTEKSRIPSDRASKTMGIHVEFSSIDELDLEISLVKGCPGYQSGGTPSEP